MTNEEAINELRELWYRWKTRSVSEGEAINIAIKALKQEPKIGHWIKMFLTDTSDIDGQCSECGFIHKFIDGHTARYGYCPNCGAKMVESQKNDEQDEDANGKNFEDGYKQGYRAAILNSHLMTLEEAKDEFNFEQGKLEGRLEVLASIKDLCNSLESEEQA